MKNSSRKKDRPAVLRIVAIYALFVAVWLYFSDTALRNLAQDKAHLTRLAPIKGFLFILVTGSLLYYLITRWSQKHMELVEELRERQSLIDSLLQGTTDAIFIKDRQGRYLLINAAAEKIAGKTSAEVIGRDNSEVFTAQDARMVVAFDHQVIETRQVITQEVQLTMPDGTLRTFLATKGPIFDAAGEISGIFGISRDITERKEIEETLRASENRFHSLFDNMLDGFAYCRMWYEDGVPKDFMYLDVNPSFERLIGLKNVIGRMVTDVNPGIRQSNPELFEIYGRVAQGGKTERFEVYLNSLNIWLSVSVYCPEKGYFIAVFDNISERKRAEEVLVKSEAAAKRLAQEKATIAEIGRIIGSSLVIVDVYESFAAAVGKLISFDRLAIRTVDKEHATTILAYSAGVHIPSRSKGSSMPLAESAVGIVVRTRQSLFLQGKEFEETASKLKELQPAFQAGIRSQMVIPLISRDQVIGVLSFMSTQYTPYSEILLKLAESIATQIAAAVANAQLFHEWKQGEEALRASEERYRQFVELSPDPILLHQDGKIIFINPAGLRILGGKEYEDILGKPSFDFIHPAYHEIVKERVRLLGEGQTVPMIEEKYIRLDGIVIDIEIIGFLFNYQGKPALHTVFHDITERKHAAEQLQASLKEKEVLLKEIHHRVKNNLQIISSLLRMQSRSIKDEEFSRVFQDSQQRIHAIAMIHEKLYRSTDFSNIEMVEYTRDLVSHLCQTYGIESRKVAVRILGEKVLLDMGRTIPFGLILNELVSNALKHAFPERNNGGIEISLVAANDRIRLNVKDNGVGLPAGLNIRETETLGFQIVMSLAQQLEGTVGVSSGEGTEFQIDFPAKSRERGYIS